MANKGIFLRLAPEIEEKLGELMEYYTNEVAKADKSAVVSKSIEEMHSFMNEIMAPEKPKPVYKGFYLDADVVAVLEQVALKSGKKGSKGVQSKIVNESLRMFFKDSGLLKEE